jgi:hypothetical protein
MGRLRNMQRMLPRELTDWSLLVDPLAVFLVGNWLFDQIGKPFADHVLQATASVAKGKNLNEVIADGHVWTATAHGYLVFSMFMLLYLGRWLGAQARVRTATVHAGIAATLAAAGTAYLAYVHIGNRPMNAIFLFTYKNLAGSESLASMQMLAFVNRTLIAINLIGISAPAALIALVPLLVREPTSGWTEREPILRVQETQILDLLASIFLAIGALRMYAWMSWAPELLNQQELGTVVGGMAFYWESVFTLILAAIYLPVLMMLQKRSEVVMDAQQVPLINRAQWLRCRGPSLRIFNQAPQAIGILAPLIASHAGRLLANLDQLAPK